MTKAPHRPSRIRDAAVAAACGAFVALMVGAAYAAVPLYDWFCRTTGFNGTTQVAKSAPGEPLDRMVTVRFDANIDPRLPWKFEPEQATVRIHPGGRTTVYYKATNYTARRTVGTASFNVSPAQAGQYFSKIECFCFTEQVLKGGESVRMPVVFYVDPKLREDPDTRDIDEITLSYTFYPVENPQSAR